MTSRTKKAIIVSAIIILSSLFMYALRLGLVLPNPVILRKVGPLYLVYKAVPVETKTGQPFNDERVILDVTRQLYQAKVLEDGHKARALSIQLANTRQSPGTQMAGLSLSAAVFERARQSTLPGLQLLEIPESMMLYVSIPRLNMLSLYVGRYQSIPALQKEAQARGLSSPARLTIYDRRITYLIPLHPPEF